MTRTRTSKRDLSKNTLEKNSQIPEPLVCYDWQEADVQHAVASITPKAGALIVSAPGAGKTLVGTEIVKRLDAKVVLIIAPLGTHRGAWGKTLLRQGMTAPRLLSGTKPGKAAFSDLQWRKPGVYITTPQWFARQTWSHISPDAVIFDEVHMAGGYGNATQKRLHQLNTPIKIAMSGTPLRNNWENAWAIIKWVQPALMTESFWVWRKKQAGKYSPFAPQSWEVTGEKEPGKLFAQLSCYIAHRQRERCCSFHPEGFLAHLAPPIRVERVVSMTKAQRKFYEEMEESLVSSLFAPDENGRVPVIAELPIVARGMLRMCANALPHLDPETGKPRIAVDAESPKVDEFISDIRALDGKRVLGLTHSKQTAYLAEYQLNQAGINTLRWTGDETPTQRDKILDAFTSGDLDAIVGVIAAMGTGTDGLQEACYNVGWLSLDDDATNNVQGIGRLDRLGQTHQVTEFYYMSAGTYDEGILPKQFVKLAALNKSLKGAA